jgi:hypothetical protein
VGAADEVGAAGGVRGDRGAATVADWRALSLTFC